MGCRNPMYGKKYKEISKELISFALSKLVYIYKLRDSKYVLSEICKNSVEVGHKLGWRPGALAPLHKSTIGKYIKKEKVIV